MRKLGLVVVCLTLLLSGCSNVHYTEELRKEYEEKAFDITDAKFEDMGCQATKELFSPDGLTGLVIGQFYTDGMPVQYVYDTETDVLWAGQTKDGYGYRDALVYAESVIGEYFEGTGIGNVDVRSLSWTIPYKEYRYDVQTEGDTKKVTRSTMRIADGYLPRPFFRYDMTTEEAERFVESQLRGVVMTDTTVDLFCNSFAEASVADMIDTYLFLSAFPGVARFRLYETCDDGRYYEFARFDAVSVKVTYHERTIDSNGVLHWSTRTIVLSE